MNDILAVIWLFLPAGVANAVPVLASKISFLSVLNIPIDQNRTFRGKRLLGDNKTVRGLVTGVLSAVIVMGIQIVIHNTTSTTDSLALIEYNASSILIAAFMGFGALFGDAVESFFKRQLSIKSGGSWYFFDQVDYILGGLLFTLPFFTLTAMDYMLLIFCWLIIHPVTTTIAWLLKLKDRPI